MPTGSRGLVALLKVLPGTYLVDYWSNGAIINYW
jgi:hypothetical protein